MVEVGGQGVGATTAATDREGDDVGGRCSRAEWAWEMLVVVEQRVVEVAEQVEEVVLIDYV